MAGNIQSFLEYLTSFTKIDFRGKECELGSLAQKYDKDHNSIFDQDELFAMQDDLSVFMQTAKNDDTETNQVNSFLSNLVEISKQNIENFKKKYLDKYSDKREFTEDDISFLAELTDKELKRAKQLFYVEGRKEQLYGDAISYLAKLNDKEFKRAKQLLKVENRTEQFNGPEIIYLAKLNDEEFRKAKELFNIENRTEQFDGDGIARLAKLNDEEFERAKQLFNLKIKTFNIMKMTDVEREPSADEIIEISKLSIEQCEQFKQLQTVKPDKLYFEDLLYISRLSTEDFKWITKFLSVANLDFKTIVYLVNNHCKELEEEIDLQFFQSEKPLHYERTSYGIEILVHSENNTTKYNVYNKTGIIETTEYEKMPDSESIVNGNKITCYNKKLKVKQETIIGDIPNTDDKKIVFSEVLTYFDDNGNIIRTVTTKRNSENGMLNVSETDKNGKQTPIQWESVDPDTGATITERHLTSPDGTKTDCYFEENDNLKVSDYKITDKNGNVLINVHQTFEQVSENKFISSILATDNPEDTQIYEMEYANDSKVIIFDKKNNKTIELDLSQYVDNEETLAKLMPSIKRLPGQILLKFAEKPLEFRYDNKLKTDARWNKQEPILRLGNYENTSNKNDNILGVLLHELGHYLDLYKTYEGKFSDNQIIKDIYKEELDALLSSTTTLQQKHVDYFIDGTAININGIAEVAGETHSTLYSKSIPKVNIRGLYLAQLMPETMAAYMKAMLEEEGVKV